MEPAAPVPAPEPKSEPPPSPATLPVSSGMPFSALEHIIVFTSGEGQAALQSKATAKMLQDIVGEDLATIRSKVPRDVVANCDIAERVRREGTIPDSAFRAMATLNLPLVQKAREGVFQICVRTFPLETKGIVTVFLFYNKAKLES
jgi:hypothetical protein